MKKGRIGFVSIAHADYVNEIVESQTAAAMKCITDVGFELVLVDEHVTDSKKGIEAGKTIASQLPDGVVFFLASWIECPSLMSVLREVEHLPIFLFAFPMCMVNGRQESTGSYVSFAMIKGTLDRVGYQYDFVLASTDSDEAKAKIENFCIAATAANRLKRSNVGLVGYTSMSIYPGTFDHVFMRKIIGPEINQLDSYTLINMAEGMSIEAKVEVLTELKMNAKIHCEVSEASLLKSAGIYLAMEKIVKEKNLNAINIKCQYEFSKEYKMVPCVPLSLMAEKGIVSSCEGDILNTVSMLILHYLTGDVVTYGDVMNHKENIVKLSSCGFLPFSMGVPSECLIRNFLPHPGFTGIQSSFTMRPGRVTVMRLIEDRCDYHILYFTGEGLKTELRQGYMPAIDVKVDGDINNLIENFSGQHYAICFGDVSEKIEALAKILKIKTIRVKKV